MSVVGLSVVVLSVSVRHGGQVSVRHADRCGFVGLSVPPRRTGCRLWLWLSVCRLWFRAAEQVLVPQYCAPFGVAEGVGFDWVRTGNWGIRTANYLRDIIETIISTDCSVGLTANETRNWQLQLSPRGELLKAMPLQLHLMSLNLGKFASWGG